MDYAQALARLAEMEEMIKVFPPDIRQKIEMAKATLEEAQKIDPLVMTLAMFVVSGRGLVRMMKNKDEIIEEYAKNKS